MRPAQWLVKIAGSPRRIYALGSALSVAGGTGLVGLGVAFASEGRTLVATGLFAGVFVGGGLYAVMIGFAWSNHKLGRRIGEARGSLRKPEGEVGKSAGAAEGEGGYGDALLVRRELSEQVTRLHLSLERIEGKVEEAVSEGRDLRADERTTQELAGGTRGRELGGVMGEGRGEHGGAPGAGYVRGIQRATSGVSGERREGSSKGSEKASRGGSEKGTPRDDGEIESLREELQGEARRTREAMTLARRQLEAWEGLQHYLAPQSLLPPPGGFTIEPDLGAYLVGMIIERRPGLVVELGSGLSTVLMGLALEKVEGGRLVALEHDHRFKDESERLLRRFGLTERVAVRLCELADVPLAEGTFQWYDAGCVEELSGIDLVLVDGPPGFGGAMARYPAVPKLLPRMNPGGVIVVDDYKRQDEHEAVRSWVDEYEVELIEAPGHLKGSAVLRAHGGDAE